MKQIYKETTNTFFYSTFKLKFLIFLKKNLFLKNDKNLVHIKNFPQGPKPNLNLYSPNTPFIITFLIWKSIMGIDIYAIFILFQAFNQIIKPTVKCTITLHIPKLL